VHDLSPPSCKLDLGLSARIFYFIKRDPQHGLLPSYGEEHCEGVGERGEAARGDSGNGSPSNLPPAAACSLYVAVFLVSASVHREIKSQGIYIGVFRSNPRRWHED
jgi:hypothetical protein